MWLALKQMCGCRWKRAAATNCFVCIQIRKGRSYLQTNLATTTKLSANNLPSKDDTFRIIRCDAGYEAPNVVIEQITSVEGKEVNMLTLKRHDDKWT
jgi:hypothetical protein